MTSEQVLLVLWYKCHGDIRKVQQAIADREQVSDQEVNDVEKIVADLGYKYTTILRTYPKCSSEIDSVPTVLFYKGDINLFSTKLWNLAMLGKRSQEVCSAVLSEAVETLLIYDFESNTIYDAHEKFHVTNWIFYPSKSKSRIKSMIYMLSRMTDAMVVGKSRGHENDVNDALEFWKRKGSIPTTAGCEGINNQLIRDGGCLMITEPADISTLLSEKEE